MNAFILTWDGHKTNSLKTAGLLKEVQTHIESGEMQFLKQNVIVIGGSLIEWVTEDTFCSRRAEKVMDDLILNFSRHLAPAYANRADPKRWELLEAHACAAAYDTMELLWKHFKPTKLFWLSNGELELKQAA